MLLAPLMCFMLEANAGVVGEDCIRKYALNPDLSYSQGKYNFREATKFCHIASLSPEDEMSLFEIFQKSEAEVAPELEKLIDAKAEKSRKKLQAEQEAKNWKTNGYVPDSSQTKNPPIVDGILNADKLQKNKPATTTPIFNEKAAHETCKSFGMKKGTKGYMDCMLKIREQDLLIKAKDNQRELLAEQDAEKQRQLEANLKQQQDNLRQQQESQRKAEERENRENEARRLAEENARRERQETARDEEKARNWKVIACQGEMMGLIGFNNDALVACRNDPDYARKFKERRLSAPPPPSYQCRQIGNTSQCTPY